MNKTRQAVLILSLCAPLLSGALWEDRGEYVEVTPGTKLCDPGEDVYGYYLIQGSMNPDKTQDVLYYRFGALIDMKTGIQQRIWQPIGGSSRWIKRHPREKDKLQVINPTTGEADEFLYAPCKKQ
ncbi:MAG TPA: hypothetical protein VGJ57_12760 [Nitrospirales bacterium]|jgi:hypothetical protein